MISAGARNDGSNDYFVIGDPKLSAHHFTVNVIVGAEGGVLLSVRDLGSEYGTGIEIETLEKRGGAPPTQVRSTGEAEITRGIVSGEDRLIPGDIIRSESGTERVVIEARGDVLLCTVNKNDTTSTADNIPCLRLLTVLPMAEDGFSGISVASCGSG